MIFNYYGTGKGKTTASLGLLMRYLGYNKKACLIQFDKYNTISHEHNILKKLNVDYFVFGCNRILKNNKFRFGYTKKDLLEIKKGVDKFIQIYYNYNLIILDEFNIVWNIIKKLNYNYNDLLKIFLSYQNNISKDLVITGMIKNKDLIKISDLVSEVKNIKHYFDKGTKARDGIEY